MSFKYIVDEIQEKAYIKQIYEGNIKSLEQKRYDFYKKNIKVLKSINEKII